MPYYNYPSSGDYWGSYGSGSYGSSYGWGSYGGGNRYGRSDFDRDRRSIYDANSYYYGYRYGNRRRRNYWERDRDSYRSWRSDRRDTPSPPPPAPKPEPPKEEIVKTLNVKKANYNIEENTSKHETQEFFDCSEKKPAELVLRRGFSFKLTIEFDRPYDKKKNDLKLIFSIGEKPLKSKGTKAVFDVDETEGKKFKCDEWGAALESKDGNHLSILVYIPCDCIIGEWNFVIRTFSEGKDKDGKDKTLKFDFEDEPITILFNPWCKDDAVYMENSIERNEYVTNDSGCVYKGNTYQPDAVSWNFGQYEEDILDIVLQLFRSGYTNGVSKKMSNPVNAARKIAQLVNSSDDKGLLVGKWQGDYSDGTTPWTWKGSPKIIREWKRSGPVKYGQCWVFSAVTTTVCRVLGIPCRSVTNYSSAHDTQKTHTIDKFFNENDDAIEEWNTDSVWNFHVWNEVWMPRPDLKNLKTGFEYLRKPGWQVIDATPQETSGGVYTCGPCPVEAVYRGYCTVDYDTGFVFSEVNADVVHWTHTNTGDFKVKSVMTRSVGDMMATKKADGLPCVEGMDQVQDLTLKYKPNEGTAEERDAVHHAVSTTWTDWGYNYMHKYKENRGNVVCRLLHDNETQIGKDLKIQLKIINNENETLEIAEAEISVAAQDYLGWAEDSFFKQKFNQLVLKPNEETLLTAMLDHNEYLDHVVEQGHFQITGKTKYRKVGDSESHAIRKDHKFRFRRPDIEISCQKSARVGEKVQFVTTFRNPLDRPLTNCRISADPTGFEDMRPESVGDVPANGEFKQTFTLKALRRKKHAVVTFSFDSKQLHDIGGAKTLEIEK